MAGPRMRNKGAEQNKKKKNERRALYGIHICIYIYTYVLGTVGYQAVNENLHVKCAFNIKKTRQTIPMKEGGWG